MPEMNPAPDFESRPDPSPNPVPDLSPRQRHSPAKMRETILATASGGMAIAMSTILSLLPFFEMHFGGSMTPASMLPILVCALAFGPGWGVGICTTYGVLQFVIKPYAAHWASIILDYPAAFGLLGLAGLFAAPKLLRQAERNILHRIGMIPLPRVILALVIGMAGRLAGHVLSGVIFYAEYAAEAGYNSAWIYSLAYNGTYMLPELILTAVIMVSLAAIFRPRPQRR